tara:strand:- start:4826 stop:5260 length:435 start_codon:yes stop_codon:yes gene_type:complete
MLAELAIANAAFKVIKTTLQNGKELADAGSAVANYFGAEKTIAKKAASGQGDALAAFQAKRLLEKQEKELEFLLNKQGLLGYHNFLKFKAEYTRNLREAEKAERREAYLKRKAFNESLTIAIQVFGALAIIMAALFGVALYMKF